MHVLLLGERDVPPSPLICSTELNVLVQINEVDQLYFCYVLSPFLSVDHDVDDANVDNGSCLPTNNEHTLSSLSLKEHSSALHSSKGNVLLMKRCKNCYKNMWMYFRMIYLLVYLLREP